MKILILTNSDSGLYNFRKELLDEMIKEGEKIYISVPYGNRIEYFKNMGCDCINTDIDRRGTNPIKDIKLFFKYLKILKQVKPDIVLTYTIKPNIYGGIACRYKKIKCIANVTGLGSSFQNKGLLKIFILKLYKIAFKKTYCIFFQNKDNLKFMIDNKVVQGKYRLIPGSGVNLEYHKIIPYPENKKITFLFISRIIYEKGIDEYLEVAKEIKEKYPNTEFHILGSCNEDKYTKIINKLEKEGIVIYHGEVKDIREYQKISNCTIHPSFYQEGMSNVLLETLAAGRPVITTNRPGCRETVEEGINGYLVEEKNTDMLIETVEKFINLPYEEKKKMGLNGRKKVEEKFDRNIVINAYMEEIGKINDGL